MNQKFPAAEKLKQKKYIDFLFSEGRSVSKYPIKLIYAPLPQQEKIIYTGVSVPKKNFKKAVQRNYIKRLLRESYRLNKYLIVNNINCSYAFMFIYVGKEISSYEEVFSNFEKLLKKFAEKEIIN